MQNDNRLVRSRRTNRVLAVATLFAVLGWGLGASDERITIGFVDIDQAINSTKQGLAAREEFERKKREAESQLRPLMEQIQNEMREFESKKFVLSDDARFQKQLDLAELQNQFENRQKSVEGQLQVDRERLIAPLRNKLVKIVEEVGRQEGFSLILHRQSPGVMYWKEALDVTDLIIERFNKQG
jgi:outer membrane protein